VLTLADFLEALMGIRPELTSHGVMNRLIPEVTIDSRQVIPGALFVALPGQRVDGHDFVAQAFQNGADFALVQQDMSTRLAAGQYQLLDLRPTDLPGNEVIKRWLNSLSPESSDQPICLWVEDSLKALQQVARFWRRKLNVRVIGITGSVGKSTTKELVAEVLSQRYRTLKNLGNLNNEIGLPLTLLSLTGGYQRAVLEMGFYVPGEIAFLCDLALPHVGVVTNIGTVHAERAGSQEEIARGKSELIQALPPAPDGVAVLNHDDPLVKKMAEVTKAQVLFYGMTPEADLWADQVEGLGLEGIRFRLHYQDEVLYLRVPLIGRHSVQTALRAAAVGLVEGLTWQEIVAGLRSGSTQLRLMAVRAKSGALILDDTYNASPESVLAALNLLHELKERRSPGRKIAVLGDMLELGIYEQRGHEMVGIRAAQVVDLLITVGERGRMMADAAVQAGFPADAVVVLDTTQQAVEFLHQALLPDDIVLVKGSRGMRMERVVAALEYEA